MFFGRNYDWIAESGMLCTNQRGLLKTSFKKNDGEIIQWVSKYGSITFNQYGKEFPIGGMNEEGLVVVTYEYNDAKQLIIELSKKVQIDTLIPEFRLLREYNKNGDLIQIIREQWKDNRWVFAMQSSYQFDSDKIAQRIDSIKNNNKLKLINTKYNYDNQGKLISEVSQRVAHNDKYNLNKIIYLYNDLGLIIEKEFPIWSGDKWVDKRKMTLCYNDKGYHVITTRFNWHDNEWIENIHYDLEVDQSGNRLTELWKRSKEDYMRVLYKYAIE